MKKFISIFLFIFLQTLNINANDFEQIKRITVGQKNAKITILAYESLTCSHCADFHINVFPELKRDYIDTGIVKIEFRHFPLDIAAFNASKISQCKNDGDSKVLNSLYLNQSKWVKGQTIEDINQNLKKFLVSEAIDLDFNKCTTNKNIEDFILNDRIEGVKKYKVNATPTIIINDKKFEKTLNYKNLKKSLEKLI
ncbi:thioredoxin domain-containing protein [Candidatus Pelagibacter communis]|uniref:thioredoxin domain-containing protein n=1 Tax=Pelagibacter ubique TaxID=198252 RepID=UPI00094D35C1|nr:thioredoxin domain-containing protein [Candidatus Pelagibacter ubique]|tara:strand:- start:170 stop:757 length:588 start_codon:yes stop_codon:yes gene_type:complete